MRKKHNATQRNVAKINVQPYSEPTKAWVVALVRSCGTTELQKNSQLMENYSVVKFNSSQILFQ
jgi:hypothetical protein